MLPISFKLDWTQKPVYNKRKTHFLTLCHFREEEIALIPPLDLKRDQVNCLNLVQGLKFNFNGSLFFPGHRKDGFYQK